MYCNNCGKKGHMYKDCRLPVTSCGNIIYRDDTEEPKVLMIQRKDSLSYIEFLRGKYDINDSKYIVKLFNGCPIALIEYLFVFVEYLFTLKTMLFRLDECSIMGNEQQKV